MMKRIIMLLLACCLLVGAAAAAGGSGTVANPYIIEAPAELQSIQNNLAAYYVLGNDIDLSGVTWTPIGSGSAPFTGSLDGKGHTIKNLNAVFDNNYVCGLFGTGSACTITNLKLYSFDITGKAQVGILISSLNGGTISNIEIDNCVFNSAQNSGFCIGIGGRSACTISNIDIINSKIISTGYQVGFCCGSFQNSGIINIDNVNVYNSILVSNSRSVGGIVGFTNAIDNLDISNCDISNSIILASVGRIGGCIGVIGEANYDVNIESVSVSSCTFVSDTASSDGIGGICFAINSGGSGTHIIMDCTISDSTILGISNSAGIIPIHTTETVTNCVVSNTNIYGSTIYDIGPPGSYDSTSTASDITNIADRYLYASGLTATPNGATAAYTLEDRQGSTTIEAAQGTAQSWAWTFGDGQTSTAAEDTTHTYAAPGTYQTSLTLKNYLDSTGITVRTQDYNILPIPPTVSASAQTLQLGQSVTLNAVGTLFSTIQWQYSTNNGASWQDISGATANNYVWTPAAGSYQVRAHVTAVGTGYTAESEVLSISVYAPPTINAVTVSPLIGQYTQTITLSAEVTDSGPTATTYQWQQSPQGQNTWTDIPGATTAQWIGQLTFAGATDIRLIATGTGGQTISQTITYYIALPGEIQSLSATPSVVTLPGSTTLSATGANVVSWEWQELVSGSWVTVGYGASVQESFSAEGTYTYRVLATGADGNTITSETVEVLAGFAPSVSITSPADNVQFPTQSQITVSADITGTDVIYQWDFGSPRTVNGGNTNPTWVTYLVDGQYTITLRAESIFGSTSDSVTIVSGVMPRPMATDKLDSVSTAPMTAFVESFNVPQGEIIDLPAVFGSLTAPMSDLLPDGMFMVIVFGVIFIMLWIMTKNTAVPSIIGLIFGGFILALLPANYYGAAVAILAISIVGGVIRVFIPPK